MTCIIGYAKNGIIWMGADSIACDGWDYSLTAQEKIFVKGSMIIGFTSSFRMGQLLKYDLKLPFHPNTMSTHEYLSSFFIKAVRSCFKDGGFAESENNKETGGCFLVGYQQKIFTVQSDYSVVEHIAPFASVGVGDKYARGALHALSLYSPEIDAEQAIKMALSTAEMTCNGVKGPFIIKRLDATDMAPNASLPSFNPDWIFKELDSLVEFIEQMKGNPQWMDVSLTELSERLQDVLNQIEAKIRFETTLESSEFTLLKALQALSSVLCRANFVHHSFNLLNDSRLEKVAPEAFQEISAKGDRI